MAQAVQTIILIASAPGQPFVEEALSAAGSAIKPGYLIEEIAAGTVQEHSTAADNAQRLFALPNISAGKTIDDAYAAAERVRYGSFSRGQKVNALLAASATAVIIGSPLESAGDGTVRIQTTDAATDDTQRDSLIGYAIEAVDNSGGGSEARLQIRVA